MLANLLTFPLSRRRARSRLRCRWQHGKSSSWLFQVHFLGGVHRDRVSLPVRGPSSKQGLCLELFLCRMISNHVHENTCNNIPGSSSSSRSIVSDGSHVVQVNNLGKEGSHNLGFFLSVSSRMISLSCARLIFITNLMSKINVPCFVIVQQTARDGTGTHNNGIKTGGEELHRH
jgi:hypothetical protein